MTGKIEGYCCRCKANKEMVDPKPKKTANGRNMMQGTCGKCNTKLCKFVKGKGGGDDEPADAVGGDDPEGGFDAVLVPAGGIEGGKPKRKSRSRSKKGGKSRSKGKRSKSKKGGKKSKSRSKGRRA